MIYFVSDAHLGSRVLKDTLAHEKKLVSWLEMVRADATAIYLLGDIFDFWFEYKTVVPKGYVRFLGKLAELADSGIDIHFFIGNHDIWTFGYLEKEIGLTVHKEAFTTKLGNKTFYMVHGDGLHLDRNGFAFIRKIFHSRLAQWLFGNFPPRLGQEFGYRWSYRNRLNLKYEETGYKGENNENIVVWAKNYAETHDVDFLIFGHRHVFLDLEIKNKKRVVILGDFCSIFSYGVFDGNEFRLEYFEE